MTEHSYHLIHVDDTKQTSIVGFIGNPTDTLQHDELIEHLNRTLNMDNRDALFVNIIPLNTYGLRVNEQRAVVDFIDEHPDHTHVERFIHHFNTTEGDIEQLITFSGDAQARNYFVEKPMQLINEILIDAMLKQVHA